MFLLTLISSKKFLKREVLLEELDDDIILQKETEDRFHSSSIQRANPNHIILRPISIPDIKTAPGVNKKSKKQGNQNNPNSIIKPHHEGPSGSSKLNNNRPKQSKNPNIPQPPNQGINIFKQHKPRL